VLTLKPLGPIMAYMNNTNTAANLPAVSIVEYRGSIEEFHGEVIFLGPNRRDPRMVDLHLPWYDVTDEGGRFRARPESIRFVRETTPEERAALPGWASLNG
jgi:hypothetical protein